jgi:glycerol-3-phosphate dehydrogenase
MSSPTIKDRENDPFRGASKFSCMSHFDLVIIGGGINGAGIARDAAGRGLSVLMAEQHDLAWATSSSSSKLIHGGLRYLEYYEFRLVAEALAEREVLLSIAPHIVWPLEFVLPHEPHLRPAWMIRLGLFLYDHIGGRTNLAMSKGVALSADGYGAGLKPEFQRGFSYSDGWVDDARLVVLNARSAVDHGAQVLPRTRCSRARRDGALWRVTLTDASGEREVTARVLINAAGPWVKHVIDNELGIGTRGKVRLVKGSHIVVPRIHDKRHAYILQNSDRRIIFLIPYEREFTLIGTTDVSVSDTDHRPEISKEEITYLCEAASRYTRRAVTAQNVVWAYSGVRPLYDDGSPDPSAVTRDYHFELDAGVHGEQAPLLSIFGGKITTYRKLAEHALEKLAHWLPVNPAWTHREALPGGDFAPREHSGQQEAVLRLAWRPPSRRRSVPCLLGK